MKKISQKSKEKFNYSIKIFDTTKNDRGTTRNQRANGRYKPTLINTLDLNKPKIPIKRQSFRLN